MKLRDFQEHGSEFLQGKQEAMLLDDAGLGKSAQVLAAADKLQLPRILCVGPAVASVSWRSQVRIWSPKRRFVDLDMAGVFGLELPGVYFVSYDMLSRRANSDLLGQLLGCVDWDLLVLDEAQYLKNPGSNRTSAVYGAATTGRADPLALVSNARRVWLLSGTLTPNHNGELYPHLRALFGLPSEQHEFEDDYCVVRETVYGRSIARNRNTAQLRRLIAPHILRRLKSAVLTELAPMEFFTAPIALDEAVVRKILAYSMAPGKYALAEAAALSADPDALLAFLEEQPNFAAARRDLGLAKTPGCAAWVEDRLNSGERKVIVFAVHTAVIDGLRNALADHSPVVLDGRTTTAGRIRAVDAFQNDPATRVFIGQLVAAGTAITLTASSCVFFAEYAGTPGLNYQAASRAHRIGQNCGVQVYFGMVPDSLDAAIAETAKRRAREIADLFD